MIKSDATSSLILLLDSNNKTELNSGDCSIFNETPASFIFDSINSTDSKVFEETKISNSFDCTCHSKCSTNSHSGIMKSGSVYKYIDEEKLGHSNIVFEKDDFRNIKIIGQFNQGFILGVLEKNHMKTLLAVDQHAADEITNFERLQKTFKLKKQQLLQPIDLDLSVLQQLLVEDNIEIFANNGFEVKENKLYSLPVYHGTIFSVADFYSLLTNISNDIFTSDKFRDIMASKACRSSIMIGDSLNLKEMQSILDNLSMLNSPWNCPHGRPTFKILSEY